MEYKGKITTWDMAKHDSDNEYFYAFNDKKDSRIIDAHKSKKALARYANDANGVKRVKGIGNNCIYVNDGCKAYIKSVKIISAGSEILVKYGKEYWDVKKANFAIDKAASKKKAN